MLVILHVEYLGRGGGHYNQTKSGLDQNYPPLHTFKISPFLNDNSSSSLALKSYNASASMANVHTQIISAEQYGNQRIWKSSKSLYNLKGIDYIITMIHV